MVNVWVSGVEEEEIRSVRVEREEQTGEESDNSVVLPTDPQCEPRDSIEELSHSPSSHGRIVLVALSGQRAKAVVVEVEIRPSTPFRQLSRAAPNRSDVIRAWEIGHRTEAAEEVSEDPLRAAIHLEVFENGLELTTA